MYWELWLSQVTASAALQCMLLQNKGEHNLCVDDAVSIEAVRDFQFSIVLMKFQIFIVAFG